MRTVYKPQTRYCCNAISDEFGAPMCLHLDGACIEAAVVAAFFQALAPAELDLLDAVLTEQQADHERLLRQHDEQVARAEYEVRLAQRQYRPSTPITASWRRSWSGGGSRRCRR